MIDPFEVLGVPRDADDATIRQAYLSLVRQYPPETQKKGFLRIRDAFKAIETENQRIDLTLLPPNIESMPSPLDLVEELLESLEPGIPEKNAIQKALSESARRFRLEGHHS